MLNVSDIYGGEYLRTKDAVGQKIVGKITGVTLSNFPRGDGKIDTKIVIAVTDLKKPIVLNKSNALRLSRVLGDDASKWVGSVVTVTTSMEEFFGRVTVVLVVIPDEIQTGAQKIQTH